MLGKSTPLVPPIPLDVVAVAVALADSVRIATVGRV